MGAPRYAQKRDSNEPEVVKHAGRLGWRLWCIQAPRSSDDLASDWVGLRRGQWHVIEVKDPKKEGHADEFTAMQRIFHRDVFNCGGKVLVWRTLDDVIADSNARQTA